MILTYLKLILFLSKKIKQASSEKLIERLLDLRFLSIDFLNTFLLTYRVFTDSMRILNSLKKLRESSSRQFNNIDMTKLEYIKMCVLGHFLFKFFLILI